MIKRLGIFLVCSLVFWVIVALPARHFLGEYAVSHSATAMLLCLLPSTLSLLLAAWAEKRDPGSQMLVVLGGTGLRLVFVGILAVVLHSNFTYFREHDGWLMWVLLFYLVTLALEVGVVVIRPAAGGSAPSLTTPPVAQETGYRS